MLWALCIIFNKIVTTSPLRIWSFCIIFCTVLTIASFSVWTLFSVRKLNLRNILFPSVFDVCVTVCHCQNNTHSQLDAKIISSLIISISSSCFGRWFRPSSGALDCVYSLWYKAPMMLPTGDQDEVELVKFHLILVTRRQHRRCFTPQAVTPSSTPEDGRNYRPKHVQLIEIINKLVIVVSSWLFILLHYFFRVLLVATPICLLI